MPGPASPVDPGHDCAYRRLYESSQLTLSDMASRQAEAVRQRGELRSGLLRMLRHAWPRQVAEIERHQSMESLSDHHLLMYLSDLLGSERDDGRDRLREALLQHGLDVPDSDELGVWADELARQPPSTVRLHDVTTMDEGGAEPWAASQDALTDDVPPPAAPLDEDEEHDATAPAPIDVPPPVAPLDEEPEDEVTVPEGDLDGLVTLLGHPPSDAHNAQEVEGGHADEGASEHATEDAQESPPREPNAGDNTAVAGVDPRATPPLRPEPAAARTSGTRTRRKPRVRAERAEPLAKVEWDVPPEADPSSSDGAELTEEATDALLAAVTIPRPVFTSDLAGIATPEQLQRWQERESGRYPDSPVRFVAPRKRHRKRGALVVPQQTLRDRAGEFAAGSWWAEALQRYHGARLYELAVLLHRVGDDVVAHRFGDHTASLRLHQRNGLVGIVAVLAGKLEGGGDAREEFASAVETALSERLAMLVILATHGGVDQALPEVVAELAAEREWRPQMPVVGSTSWEWADAPNAAATPLLGV